MSLYRLTDTGIVIRNADGANIPSDAANLDRAAYDAWLAGGGVPDPHVPVVVAAGVPREISRRQFFQQLAVDGVIDEAEAKAAVKTGDLPDVLIGFVAALPQADRFAAEMLLAGASVFLRDHPLTSAVGAAQGRTAAEIDAFFRAAAEL